MGKVGITHTSLLGRKEPYMRLSFLFNFIISCHLLISSLLTQLFHCLSPTETLPPLLVAEGWGESRKPNQGNRYDRCNLRYQISRQLSPTSPWIHRAGSLPGILQEPQGGGDAKTYHQSNFPPGPPTKQSVWGNTCIIHLFAETAMGEHRRAETVARGWEAGTKERPVFTICSA